MRWGLLVVALAACGKVEKAAPDAPVVVPDAPAAVTLSSVMTPTSADSDALTAPVSVHVHTLAPSELVDVTFTSTLGGYAPSFVGLTTDTHGDAIASTVYTSNMAGTEMTSIAASMGGPTLASTTAQFPVVPVTSYGAMTPFPMKGSFSPNYLLGEKITVTAAGHLRKLGFISAAAGPEVQIGIYADAAGHPGALVAQLPPTSIAMGVNEVVIDPVELAAGDYWFEAVYNQTGSIFFDLGGTTQVEVDYVTFTFGGALPTTFPTPTTYMGYRSNYYLVFGQ